MAINSATVVTILYNSVTIGSTTLNGESFYSNIDNWIINSTVITNMMSYSSWGPNFDLKCFIGIYSNKYTFAGSINHLLGYNGFAHYSRFDSTGTSETKLVFFCFGYGY
jgi:hypothetical protein